MEAISPPVHQVENLVSVPEGTPQTDLTAPKILVTQDQVNFWCGMAGKFFPSIAKFAPQIAAWSSAVAIVAGLVGNYYAKVPSAAVAIQPIASVAPADDFKAYQIRTEKRFSDLIDALALQRKSIDALGKK